MIQTVNKIVSACGYVIQCYAITHCVFRYVGDFVLCSGPSMEPTIYTNDILLTEHLSQRLPIGGNEPSILSSVAAKVTRGDIVIALSPDNPHQQICKRVVALPGDVIRIGGPGPLGRSEYIPRGHVWLEGDNKHNSCDSRTFGAVPIGLLKGRAIIKIWPLQDSSIL